MNIYKLAPAFLIIGCVSLLQNAHGQSESTEARGLLAEVKSLKQALAENVMRTNEMAPSGTIVAFGGNQAPPGWLLCDGSALCSKDEKYKSLFQAIGTNWGNGSKNASNAKMVVAPNVTDFNVPDLRGYFLRGIDTSGESRDPDGSGRDAKLPGGNSQGKVGSYLGDQFKAHDHSLQLWEVERASGYGQRVPYPNNEYRRPPYRTDSQGGNETRPKNAAVHYIIKM